MFQQLSLFESMAGLPAPPLCGPLQALKPDTDPSWVEQALDFWTDPARLRDYLQALESDVWDMQARPADSLSEVDKALQHDLRDSIRVLARRLKELK